MLCSRRTARIAFVIVVVVVAIVLVVVSVVVVEKCGDFDVVGRDRDRASSTTRTAWRMTYDALSDDS